MYGLAGTYQAASDACVIFCILRISPPLDQFESSLYHGTCKGSLSWWDHQSKTKFDHWPWEKWQALSLAEWMNWVKMSSPTVSMNILLKHSDLQPPNICMSQLFTPLSDDHRRSCKKRKKGKHGVLDQKSWEISSQTSERPDHLRSQASAHLATVRHTNNSNIPDFPLYCKVLQAIDSKLWCQINNDRVNTCSTFLVEWDGQAYK